MTIPFVIGKLNNTRESIFGDLKPVSYGIGRICSFPGCDTRINRYRDSRVCSSHTVAYCQLLEDRYLKKLPKKFRKKYNTDCKVRQIWDKRTMQHV